MSRSRLLAAGARAAALALLAGASLVVPATDGFAQIAFRGSTREAAVANVGAYRSSGAVVVANSGNVTANMPSGFAEGDFLLAVIEAKDNVAVSMPAGWTAMAGSPQTIGTTHRASLFWKIARRSDGNTVTITHSGGDKIMARVHAFQGANQFSPFDGTPVLTANASVQSVVANGPTTETTGGLLIASMHASERTNGSPSVPAPWTLQNEDSNNAGSNGIAIALATRTPTAAGAQGSLTFTRNAPVAPATGAQIALQPPITIDKPAGTVAGDVLIAGIAVRESSSLTITPPAGWTLVRRINSPGGSFPSTLAVYWRAAVASEPNQYTFTVTGGTTTGIVGVIQAFSGVDTVNPIVVENGQATGSSFSHTAPSITPTVPNTMLVSNYHFISASTWSVPATSPATTEANEVSSFEVFDTLGISMMGAYAPGPAANVAAGTRTAQATSNASTNADTGAAHILALRPASATVASFLVTSAATASTCVAQPVVIRARDAVGNTLTSYTGTVSLSTSTGTGGWAASGTSGPVVENGNANDGIASYTFRAADSGQVTLLLTNQSASNLAVTAVDSVITTATGTSAAVAFRDNAFVIEEDLSSLVAGAGTVVAGRPHDVRVTLWRRDVSQSPANCAIADGYGGTRNLKAWLSLDTQHPAGATAPSIDAPAPGTDLAAVPSAVPGANNLSLAFTAGVANFTLNTTDVGKYVLNLRDDTRSFANAVDISGSSTTLTVRPFALAVTGVSKGAVTNPGGSATAGGAFVAAGDTFSATVGGYLWNTADDANNDGLPDSGATNVINNGLAPRFAWPVTLAPASTASPFFSPSGGVLGALTGTTTVAQLSFSGGAATVSDLRYSEVGSIGLSATLTGYLGTAGVDLAGTAVNATGQSVAVGRFFPDRFELLAGATVTPFCGGASGFVYMDQPALGLAFTLEARNALNVRTQNYRTTGYTVGAVSLVAENADAGVNLGGRLAGLPTGTWIAGSYAVNTTSALFGRLAAPDGSYESLVLGVIATDPDGARLAGRDMNASVSGCGGGCDARALNAGTPVRARFGRLRVGNALGSPVLGLPVPLSLEFWNGSGFVRNALDSCTTLTNRNFTFGAYTAPLAACNTSGTPVTAGGITFSAGASPVFRLTAPGVRGSVDLTPNLGSTATGQSCSAGASSAATAASVPWLLGNWGGAATWDRNPTGRAAFGLYTNTSDLIYRRESY